MSKRIFNVCNALTESWAKRRAFGAISHQEIDPSIGAGLIPKINSFDGFAVLEDIFAHHSLQPTFESRNVW